MKFYFVDRTGKRTRLTSEQVRIRLTERQVKEAIEAKREDPLEEVSFMTSGGRIVCESEY